MKTGYARPARNNTHARRHWSLQPCSGRPLQHHYGTESERVLQLEELARPAIGDDEVLVRVAAASVDMGTWHCMTGLPYAMRLAGFGVRRPRPPTRAGPSPERSRPSART